MPEYITKEQAISVVKEAIANIVNSDSETVNLTDLEIEIQMTITDYTDAADVAPVVRCKDCKYAEETHRPDIVRCTNFSTYHDPWKVWRGWYCGDGERKDGGE